MSTHAHSQVPTVTHGRTRKVEQCNTVQVAQATTMMCGKSSIIQMVRSIEKAMPRHP